MAKIKNWIAGQILSNKPAIGIGVNGDTSIDLYSSIFRLDYFQLALCCMMRTKAVSLVNRPLRRYYQNLLGADISPGEQPSVQTA